jgi:hypothetical protein
MCAVGFTAADAACAASFFSCLRWSLGVWRRDNWMWRDISLPTTAPPDDGLGNPTQWSTRVMLTSAPLALALLPSRDPESESNRSISTLRRDGGPTEILLAASQLSLQHRGSAQRGPGSPDTSRDARAYSTPEDAGASDCLRLPTPHCIRGAPESCLIAARRTPPNDFAAELHDYRLWTSPLLRSRRYCYVVAAAWSLERRDVTGTRTTHGCVPPLVSTSATRPRSPTASSNHSREPPCRHMVVGTAV